MKRRTRLIFIGCATLGGTFFTTAAAQAASAAPILDQQAGAEQVTVQPGDTLSAIAARTGQTWAELAAYNGISNPDLIYAGETITIPSANSTPQPPTTSAPASDPSSGATSTVSQVSSADSSGTATGSSQAAASPSGIWGCIASHESGGNPSTNTGNGYYGMYQDTQSSWVAGGGLAYAPRADEASAAAQTAVNQNIQAQQGWGAWPVSSAACGA